MAYATIADLETRLQRTLPVAQAQGALDDAAALIDAYVGGSLTRVVNAVDYIYAYGGTRLFLPGPITESVTSVRPVDEVSNLDVYAYELIQSLNTLHRIDGGHWPSRRDVVVTRTRGWAPGSYPRRLVTINVELAARVITSPPSGQLLSARTLGDLSETYVTDLGSDGNELRDLQPNEKDDLDLWSFRAGDLYA